VGRNFKDTMGWSRKSLLNVARMGKFSSDRAIAEYCRDIWSAQPMNVDMEMDVRHESKPKTKAHSA
jgi:starch phosphorylase